MVLKSELKKHFLAWTLNIQKPSLLPQLVEKLSSMELAPGAQKVGDS